MREASWARERPFRPQQAPGALGGVAKLPTSCKRDDLRRIRATRSAHGRAALPSASPAPGKQLPVPPTRHRHAPASHEDGPARPYPPQQHLQVPSVPLHLAVESIDHEVAEDHSQREDEGIESLLRLAGTEVSHTSGIRRARGRRGGAGGAGSANSPACSGSAHGQLVGLISTDTGQDLYTDMRMISAHASAAADAACVGSSRHAMYLSIAPVKK